jgi:hypothetical protein
MRELTIEKNLHAVLGLPLTWHRTGLMPRTYEFRAGDDVLAQVASPGWFSLQMRAVVRGETWRIRKPSLFSLRILIEDWSTGEKKGEYRGGFTSGSLRTSSGREYRFTRTALLPRRIRVLASSGSAILQVVWGWLSFGQIATTTIEPAGSAEPELDLIAMTAFVVLLRRRRRAARSSAGS